MNENFYNIPTTQSPVTGTTNTTNNSAAAQQVVAQSGFEFAGILSGINGVLLAWTMFYSLVLICDFYFYRVKYNDGQVSREKRGVLSLTNAYHLWLSYVGYLVLFILYLSFKNNWFGPIIGIIAALYAIAKIIVFDLGKIPFVDKYAKNVTKYALMPLTLFADGVSKAIVPPKPPAPPGDKKPAGAPPGGDKKK
jgi:purine-cytosine permease-like protein